jgi:formate hydrogenlyase subunit 6/NADH:ubiquinone oxidoreductase subunit I
VLSYGSHHFNGPDGSFSDKLGVTNPMPTTLVVLPSEYWDRGLRVHLRQKCVCVCVCVCVCPTVFLKLKSVNPEAQDNPIGPQRHADRKRGKLVTVPK